ncbi:MAG: DNA polymerase III subunit gamma/tau [Ruminococcaceae bacterium]|nr:DNA polymerase III subunit gamma/tau [Oscillospiraceae bacterium]
MYLLHQALYRKYRPRIFDDVCGEDHVTSVLKYESKTSKFSHAYLFCGPRGTGKTSCAKILAKALNCEDPVDGNPCGKCFACTSIDDGNATDVLEMDAASNNGVDYIRDIRDEVSYTPASLKKRVYIIDEVHMLSVSAFNALLKTLEEPPEHVVFILATTEFHKLPATIVSRCQRFDFRRIKADVIAARLLHIAVEENMVLDENAAKIIAKQSQGGMRDAISLFELCSAGGYDVTPERVSEILGLTGIEILYKTAVAVSRNDISSIFGIIKSVDSSSKDISVFWSELISFWRDLLVYKYLSDEEKPSYLDLTEPEMKLLADASRRFTKEKLTYHFSLLDDAMKEMVRLPQNKRLSAELTLIKMADSSIEATTQAVLSRVSALEQKLVLLESSPLPNVSGETAPVITENKPVDQVKVTTSASTDSVPQVESSNAPVNKVEMRQVLDLGDVIERVASQNPVCAGFLNDCDCFISDDNKKVVIKTLNDFAKTMLSASSSMSSIQSALRVCGITEAGAEITIETGALPKKKPAIDELEEF